MMLEPCSIKQPRIPPPSPRNFVPDREFRIYRREKDSFPWFLCVAWIFFPPSAAFGPSIDIAEATRHRELFQKKNFFFFFSFPNVAFHPLMEIKIRGKEFRKGNLENNCYFFSSFDLIIDRRYASTFVIKLEVNEKNKKE